MGEEIDKTEFCDETVKEFKRRATRETKLLHQWFEKKQFEQSQGRLGFELEGWLLDKNHLPAPLNFEFLESLNNDQIVSELSQHNFELNSDVHKLSEAVFTDLHSELVRTWGECQRHAFKLSCDVMMVGIPPTVRDEMLAKEYLSRQNRYYALSKRVLELRQGHPIVIDIEGKDHLHFERTDITVEAAATSFQIHTEVFLEESVRFYNASQILTAPLVAITANSPFLYGKELWEETRIPIFEQTIMLKSDEEDQKSQMVTFGDHYVKESLFELFDENLKHYPVILPALMDDPPEQIRHLKLLNGTVWRWNRPIVAINDKGVPNLRIEHRAIPSGPSAEDIIANMAFFIGLQRFYADLATPPERQLKFENAKNNFYQTAKNGLRAQVDWIDGKNYNVQELIVDRLIPEAEQGLTKLGIGDKDISRFIRDVILQRARTGRTGSCWQKSFIDTHGNDFQEMAKRYLDFQKQDLPVHRWTV